MNKLCLSCALALATLLVSGLSACNDLADKNPTADSAPATSAPAAPGPSAAPLAELFAEVVAGDGKQPVRQWISAQQPHAEGYSFIEYPTEYAAGHAYYWGDWQTRAADFCAVKMLRDYTPVQIEFTLGWYAWISGRSVAQLKGEFFAAYQESGGTVSENIGASGERVGDNYLIEQETYRAGLFTRDDMDDQLTICGVMLKPAQLAVVSERNREFADLLEHSNTDQPATLAELVALMSGPAARGILDHFDFSYFKQSVWYQPLDDSDQRDYRQATIYVNGLQHWDNPAACYFAAFDAGDSAQLTFASGWYENHCGYSAAELDVAFDELFSAAGNGRINLDSLNDAYDVEYSWAYLDGVNLVRQRYLNPPQPYYSHYTLLAGDELFADVAPQFPTWSPADLPAPPAAAGQLAQLINEIAITPPTVLLATRAAGARREQDELDLYLIQPFTMRDYYTLVDPLTQRRLCAAQVLDESYLETLGFNPQWFSAQTTLTPGELEHEFTALANSCGVTAAAATMQPAATVSFNYGPLVITFRRGVREDQTDDWYSIRPPIWPE